MATRDPFEKTAVTKPKSEEEKLREIMLRCEKIVPRNEEEKSGEVQHGMWEAQVALAKSRNLGKKWMTVSLY